MHVIGHTCMLNLKVACIYSLILSNVSYITNYCPSMEWCMSCEFYIKICIDIFVQLWNYIMKRKKNYHFINYVIESESDILRELCVCVCINIDFMHKYILLLC